MLNDQDTLVMPTGWASWTTTYGYIDNVGAAIAATIGSVPAKSQVFNVAEENPVCQLDWARKFAKAIDWQGSIEVVDDPNDPFSQRLTGLDLAVPFKIDGAKLRNQLAYTDVVDEATALTRTIASTAKSHH